MAELDWLPEELHPVALRVAHADELCLQVVQDSHRWSRQGPVQLVARCDEKAESLVVRSVAPVPPRISLLFSDAIHQLRATLDNVVFHLASETVDGTMNAKQERAASFPIAKDAAALKDWSKRMSRDGLPGLTEGPLAERITALQPFVDPGRQIESVTAWLGQMLGMPVDRVHALTLLQEYSNQDKHRTLRTAGHAGFTTVYGETFGQDSRSPHGLAPGDVVASIPLGSPETEVEIWPYVTIERPFDPPVVVGAGPELERIIRYVADVAIPVLLTGEPRSPGIPTTVDLEDWTTPVAQRLSQGESPSVRERIQRSLDEGLAEAEALPLTRAPQES